MTNPTTSPAEPLPLRYLLSPPASFDEVIGRTTVAAGRLIAQIWDRQKLMENCAASVQVSLFSTAEQLWRQSLEMCYLREPRRSERIKVA